jgi:archaellum biogenesis ATPase FlaH
MSDVRIYTYAELSEQPAIVPTLIAGLIPQASIVVLYGPPGAGKTFLALHMGHSIARGITCLNRDVVQGGVLYVAAEGSNGLPSRVRAWCLHHGFDDPGPVGYILTRLESHLADVREHLRAEFIRTGIHPVVVFIDTFSANGPHGFNENDTAHVKELLDGVRKLRDEFNCAVVVLHHPGWHQDRLRGARDLQGAADVVLKLVGGPADGPRTVSVEKARDFQAGEEIRLTLEPAHGSLIVSEGAKAADIMTASQRALLRALYEEGDGEPVRPSDWERASGYKKSQFYAIRAELQALGLIISADRGKVMLTAAGIEIAKGVLERERVAEAAA